MLIVRSASDFRECSQAPRFAQSTTEPTDGGRGGDEGPSSFEMNEDEDSSSFEMNEDEDSEMDDSSPLARNEIDSPN